MGWIKLKKGIEMWEKPCLGTVTVREGKRFMALCVDPSSQKGNYRGIARHVYKREGSEDIPGFVDHSKLVIVKSKDLLSWTVEGDLIIKNLDTVIRELHEAGKEFIGLEDPDILVDSEGIKHVYFTLPFKHFGKDRYDIYVGYAQGKHLENLTAYSPVLGKVNHEITGFKEICFIQNGTDLRFLTETFVHRGKDRDYSAIALIKAKSLSSKWDYLQLAHDPEKEVRSWCAGHSSPCKILAHPMINAGKNVSLLIMNGREKLKIINGTKVYGDFLPGLATYNSKTGAITHVAAQPLFKDPDATTITFASEFIPYDKKHGLLYCHVNDSFVRAYKINFDVLKI